MNTPDDIVAGKIVTELRERRLLREEDLADVGKKLLSGRAKPEDWRMWAEKALAGQEGGCNA